MRPARDHPNGQRVIRLRVPRLVESLGVVSSQVERRQAQSAPSLAWGPKRYGETSPTRVLVLRRRRWRAAGCYVVFHDRRAQTRDDTDRYASCWRRRKAGTSRVDGSSPTPIT
jgi:hypothetical protein